MFVCSTPISVPSIVLKRLWQPFVNLDKNHERLERPYVKRDTRHELKRGHVGCRSSNARHLGCVFRDMKPPKSIVRKSSDMQKPIHRVKFTKAIGRHTKIRDHNLSIGKFAQVKVGLRRRQSGKSKVPAKQRGNWPKVY